MATLNITAPDQHVLHIQVPDGTDPSKYDSIIDEVIAHYGQQSAASNLEFERGPNYPPVGVTTFGPSVQVAMLPSAVKGAADLGVSAAKGIAEGLSNAPEAAAGAVDTIKAALPNPSIKALGYNPSQLATEGGQTAAKAAQDYATTAQPDIGALVAKAGQPRAGPMDLITKAANDEMTEPISAASTAGEANSPANTSIFNEPIANGMSRSAAEMRDLATEQWKQAGNAIGNTLKGLDETGEKFDPQPVLQKINSMFLKDAEGKLMTTGVQGETNEALKDAVASLNDYSKGQPMSFTDANKIKGMLQDSANYAAKRFDESNEAYKQAASLIKEGIDDQAGTVLAKNGGDVQNFQALRGAYGKLSSLKQSLNVQAGRELLQPSFTESLLSVGKKLLPYGVAGGVIAKGVSEVMK